MKWAIPKRRDTGVFVVPPPKRKAEEQDPAYGDFNLPIPDDELEEDEDGVAPTETNGGK
jgi:hypothetical protein